MYIICTKLTLQGILTVKVTFHELNNNRFLNTLLQLKPHERHLSLTKVPPLHYNNYTSLYLTITTVCNCQLFKSLPFIVLFANDMTFDFLYLLKLR